MSVGDINKTDMYESVKTLVETDSPHLHFAQQKLYTLYSIAFNYMLFLSTKEPGAYIIRIEDSNLYEKLARKSKDPTTRKFMQALGLPRKLKYQKSTFFLDFFHVGSWALTSDIPKEKIKGALIVKSPHSKPMQESAATLDENGEEEQDIMAQLPPNYYLNSLKEFIPRSITIAFETEFDDLTEVSFPFIKKEVSKVSGLTISKGIDLDLLE